MNKIQIYIETFRFVIRLLASAILLLAAISKLQVAPAILRGESLLSNPWLLYLAIIVEFAVATFALLAPPRSAWAAITVLRYCSLRLARLRLGQLLLIKNAVALGTYCPLEQVCRSILS